MGRNMESIYLRERCGGWFRGLVVYMFRIQRFGFQGSPTMFRMVVAFEVFGFQVDFQWGM